MKDRIQMQLVALREAGTMEVLGAGPLDGSRVVCFQLHDFKKYKSPVYAMAQQDVRTLIKALEAACEQVARHESALEKPL